MPKVEILLFSLLALVLSEGKVFVSPSHPTTDDKMTLCTRWNYGSILCLGKWSAFLRRNPTLNLSIQCFRPLPNEAHKALVKVSQWESVGRESQGTMYESVYLKNSPPPRFLWERIHNRGYLWPPIPPPAPPYRMWLFRNIQTLSSRRPEAITNKTQTIIPNHWCGSALFDSLRVLHISREREINENNKYQSQQPSHKQTSSPTYNSSEGSS